MTGVHFSVGDDCIAVKSGKNPEGNYINRPTKNIHIFDCFGCPRGIAIGSFNTPTFESLLAVLEAAEALSVPVIIAHAQCHEDVAPLDKIGPVMVELAKRSRVKVCVHLDHGTSMDCIKKALELGFTSVMFDGSHYAIDENIAKTKQIIADAEAKGISVEAEVGAIGGEEDGVVGSGEVALPIWYNGKCIFKGC